MTSVAAIWTQKQSPWPLTAASISSFYMPTRHTSCSRLMRLRLGHLQGSCGFSTSITPLSLLHVPQVRATPSWLLRIGRSGWRSLRGWMCLSMSTGRAVACQPRDGSQAREGQPGGVTYWRVHRRRFFHRAYVTTSRRFGRETVWYLIRIVV